MNLFQPEYFKKLAELRSFRLAAEALYVSQPNVSIQISALEKEWGIVLFERGYMTVSITPAGKIMYDTITQATADFENSFDLARYTSVHRSAGGVPFGQSYGFAFRISAGPSRGSPNAGKHSRGSAYFASKQREI